MIRSATAADVPACAALIDGQPLFTPYGLTATKLEKALITALARGEQILLAEGAQGRALGFVWFELRGAFGRSGYLRLLVTAQEAQGRGLGGRLLNATETAVFAEVDDLFLLANNSNTGALRFYERQGFERVGKIDSYVAPGLDEILLRKKRPARFAAAHDD